MLSRLKCWWRGYHITPGEYGWQFYCGGFETFCGVCGKTIRHGRGDEVRPGPQSKEAA